LQDHLRRCYRAANYSCSKSQTVKLNLLGLEDSLFKKADLQVVFREHVSVVGDDPIYEVGINLSGGIEDHYERISALSAR
jgi:hypothetical protein